ncbi:MAG: radical SAM protein [Nannocystaceae bacterium]|nr:radical SAM protein [Nannocystaceae bacterium]
MTRAAVRIGETCDHACCFCAQHGIVWSAARTLEDARAAGHDEVSFVGGEPSLPSARLSEHVAAARALGFVAVGVQTNGWALAQASLRAAVCDAGLSDAHLSIHGARADVHDFHTGRAGSFAAASATATGLRARGVTVVATTVLTRSNFRVIAELPPLLERLGVAAWTVTLPHARGRAAAAFDRVLPRLALALPFALHALDRARRLGLPAAIEGAPLCLLGPFAALARNEGSRAFAAACDGCRARDGCAGVDAYYLARFGGDELRPREAVAAVAPMSDALARMFVGLGEAAASPVPASQARARLPIAERPRPGRDEQRTRAPVDAKPLFPDLLDPDDRERGPDGA